MATITQDMRYRLSLIKYAERFGVTKAAIKYKTNRQYIYRWKRRYDGSIESLRDRSRRPHHHPNQHTPEEIKLIFDMRRRNPMPGLLSFGLNSSSVVTPVPSLDYTDFSVSRELWQFIRQILNIFQSLTNRWIIRDNAYRLM